MALVNVQKDKHRQMMLRQGWTVDMYDKSLYILIIQCLCYRFIAYICLKIKMNYQ